MDSPQIPHRDAEPLRYLHLRRAGPMEAIPVGVLPGQLSRSLVNPVPVSTSAMVAVAGSLVSTASEGKDSSENRNLSRSGLMPHLPWAIALSLKKGLACPKGTRASLTTIRMLCSKPRASLSIPVIIYYAPEKVDSHRGACLRSFSRWAEY